MSNSECWRVTVELWQMLTAARQLWAFAGGQDAEQHLVSID